MILQSEGQTSKLSNNEENNISESLDNSHLSVRLSALLILLVLNLKPFALIRETVQIEPLLLT